MPFWGFYGVHPDQNLWTFDNLHQGSQIFHFKCYLKTVGKIVDFSHFKPTFAKWLHQRAY